jgi:hypothetical protein
VTKRKPRKRPRSRWLNLAVAINADGTMTPWRFRSDGCVDFWDVTRSRWVRLKRDAVPLTK